VFKLRTSTTFFICVNKWFIVEKVNRNNVQWASIAGGIIGKNETMKESFIHAMEKYKKGKYKKLIKISKKYSYLRNMALFEKFHIVVIMKIQLTTFL